jgi:hypothetical protein
MYNNRIAAQAMHLRRLLDAANAERKRDQLYIALLHHQLSTLIKQEIETWQRLLSA